MINHIERRPDASRIYIIHGKKEKVNKITHACHKRIKKNEIIKFTTCSKAV